MTNLPELKSVTAVLTERFGLALSAARGIAPDGAYIDLRLSDLEERNGFVVRTTIGWRHILSELLWDRFAGDLLGHMARADAEQKERFHSFVRLLTDQGGRVSMTVGGVALDPARAESWPDQWLSLNLRVERTPLMIDHDNSDAIAEAVRFWGGGVLGMVVSLLPLEENATETELELHGLPEGARERIEVNRYERSRINRSLCIAIHGSACCVCGFDFSSVYGEVGQGFAHVHHVTPVSKLGPGYIIDPSRDLVPVCPNCHAMLHRRDPPLSVEELRERLRTSSAHEARP